MNVIKSSIAMRSKPDEASELETECLFGETITILDEYSDWYFCKLETDNYCGWVQKKGLGFMKNSSHRIISTRTFLLKDKNIKSSCISYLSLGSQIFVNNIDKFWAQVYLPNYKSNEFGYLPRTHIVKKCKKVNDWVGIAENLIGTPYVWGGRNSMGLDCSALLQLSFQTYGEDIPRNSIDQSSLKKKIIDKNDLLKRGYVIFWKDHVAIMTDKQNCVHANAFHMRVSKEPLINVLARTEEDSPIIKVMDFN